MLALLLLIAPIQDATAQDAPAVDEIVITGTRKRKCQMRIANRILSDQEFKARAADWAAGHPVRVIVPTGTDYKCLAKIMFRLNDHGVTRANFVDRAAPAD